MEIPYFLVDSSSKCHILLRFGGGLCYVKELSRGGVEKRRNRKRFLTILPFIYWNTSWISQGLFKGYSYSLFSPSIRKKFINFWKNNSSKFGSSYSSEILVSSYTVIKKEIISLLMDFPKLFRKSGVICILVTFPSHLKKLRGIRRFCLEKMNCGYLQITIVLFVKKQLL